MFCVLAGFTRIELPLGAVELEPRAARCLARLALWPQAFLPARGSWKKLAATLKHLAVVYGSLEVIVTINVVCCSLGRGTSKLVMELGLPSA